MPIRLFATIIIGLAAPALVWLACQAVLEEILAGGALREQCPAWNASSAPCVRAFWTVVTREVAVMSGVIHVAVVVAFAAAAWISGANRTLNAAIFPRLTPIATFAIAVVVVTQAATVVSAAFLLERQFLGQAPIWIIAVFAGGALAAVTPVVRTLFKANVEQPTSVMARAIAPEQAPALWAFVDEIAGKLKAERPDNLIVGLDPTFFATAAAVRLPERRKLLRGESLYLSLPLMRLFSAEELTAVVGHELGHFRGADTNYSKRFAPIYRNLSEAIISIAGPDGRTSSIWTQAAHRVLLLMFELFARNERRISRDRELAADKAGLDVASPEALASSLAKVAVYAPLWGRIRYENVQRLGQGKVSRNLSRVYANAARYDVTHRAIGEVLKQVLATHISHPTDSHPAIAERYAHVGYDPARLTLDKLAGQGVSSGLLFANLDVVEEDLTLLEHKLMIAAGHAKPPEDEPKQNQLLNAAYVLAATLISADGRASAEEIRIAEGIGARLFSDFDAVSFRETFDFLEDVPDFLEVARVLAGPLSSEHKRLLHGYLIEIAAVDGLISQEEKALLDRAGRLWGLKGWKRLLGG